MFVEGRLFLFPDYRSDFDVVILLVETRDRCFVFLDNEIIKVSLNATGMKPERERERKTHPYFSQADSSF